MSPLLRELKLWEGTKYAPGQRVRGVAADCIGFASGVLDALYGTKTPLVKSEGWKMVRDLRQAWPCREASLAEVGPGDILVCGGVPEHFHIYIIENDQKYWHCGTAGVCYRGYPGQLRVAFLMYRKETWK
jgi:cell wall-associated NlpC family hydrolase